MASETCQKDHFLFGQNSCKKKYSEIGKLQYSYAR